MFVAVLLTAALGGSNAGLLRAAIAERALSQVSRAKPVLHPEQQDCAGFVRDAYRAAFQKVAPARVTAGLWLDRDERRVPFADASTLLSKSFSLLGRTPEVARRLQSGDLIAFRQEPTEEGDAVFHLMLVVRTRGGDGDTLVVYHPGTPEAGLRWGRLRDLAEAPIEWRADEKNTAFLGFYRFREWLP